MPLQPHPNLLPRDRTSRTSRADAPVASTIVDGGPPGVVPASTRRSIRLPSVRSISSGSAEGSAAADIGAGRGQRRGAGAAQRARDRMQTECGRRPCPFPRWTRAPSPPEPRAATSTDRPEPRRQPARKLRHHTQSIGDLIGIGGDQRQCPLGDAALDGKHTRDRIGPERIGGEPVQVSVGIAITPPPPIARTASSSARSLKLAASTTIRRTMHHHNEHSDFTTKDTKETKDRPAFRFPLWPVW